MFKRWIAVLAAAALLTLAGCNSSAKTMLQDGYYTAEMAEYNRGWKEFVTIFVQNDTIVSVEYNAKNSSGFIKSWDMDYMRAMHSITGTYPNRYTRTYGAEFLAAQQADAASIDMVSGASTSGQSFMKLAQAVLDQARAGDGSVAVVPED